MLTNFFFFFLQNAKNSITERQQEIECKRSDLKIVNVNVDDLKSKLAEAHKERDRLLSIVKDLEEEALNTKQRGKTYI